MRAKPILWGPAVFLSAMFACCRVMKVRGVRCCQMESSRC